MSLKRGMLIFFTIANCFYLNLNFKIFLSISNSYFIFHGPILKYIRLSLCERLNCQMFSDQNKFHLLLTIINYLAMPQQVRKGLRTKFLFTNTKYTCTFHPSFYQQIHQNIKLITVQYNRKNIFMKN